MLLSTFYIHWLRNYRFSFVVTLISLTIAYQEHDSVQTLTTYVIKYSNIHYRLLFQSKAKNIYINNKEESHMYSSGRQLKQNIAVHF